jgi:hypothetical protein
MECIHHLQIAAAHGRNDRQGGADFLPALNKLRSPPVHLPVGVPFVWNDGISIACEVVRSPIQIVKVVSNLITDLGRPRVTAQAGSFKVRLR